MRVIQKIFLLYLGCMIPEMMAAPLKDGAWNGKPWNKKELAAGVESKNPDALAEWAFCSRSVLNGIEYQPELIEERIKQSSDAGSELGKFLLARNLIFIKPTVQSKARGYKMIQELAADENVLAQTMLGRMYMFGDGVKPDLEKAHEILLEAKAKDCSLAHGILAFYYEQRRFPHYAPRKSRELYILDMRKFGDVHSAVNLLTGAANGEPVDKEIVREARKMVAEAALLGYPYALTFEAIRELEGGNPHLGVAMMIRAANLGNTKAMGMMAYWFEEGGKAHYDGKMQLLVHGVKTDSRKVSKASYMLGDRRSYVLRNYAEYLMREGKQEGDFDKGIDILKTSLKKNDCNAHDIFGKQLLWKYHRDEKLVDEKVRKRAQAHLIYHCDHHDLNEYWLAWYMVNGKEGKLRDSVRAAAASKSVLRRIGNDFQEYAVVLKRWLKNFDQQLTEEQKKEVEKLVESGYPHAREYREEAFNYLKQIGDLPAKSKFRE